MNVIICDRCEKEIPRYEDGSIALFGDIIDLQLCKKCWDSFEEWMEMGKPTND